MTLLVRSDRRWDPGALLLIQGVVNDRPVLQAGLSVVVHLGEGVLPPVLAHGLGLLALEGLGVVKFVNAVLEVLAGMAIIIIIVIIIIILRTRIIL